MTITDTRNRTNGSHRRQFRETIQLFIEAKMNSYNGIKIAFNLTEEATTIEKDKYRASLFMIHCLLNTMENNEIAAALDMPCDVLERWESEKIFKTLMYANYKEFLIYLGELYT